MKSKGSTLKEARSHRLEIQIDGSSKGNPGPSGIGVVMTTDSGTALEISEYVGVATNNVAEYLALVTALEEALIRGASRLVIRTDSELLAKQIKREYKIRKDNLRFLFRRAKRLMSAFEEVDVVHVSREQNVRADALAAEAIPLPGNQRDFFQG